ncbi:hypothetical protein DFH07DRAFT_1018342 [Mycena maculata]|uniref:Uncharacterized protein n=1 Tax=Mycena maculata TaxID=230809 RepID=A0AAD7JGW3_9AGAR|nr:hypothetical protein DFH07DRAFT_1018342 [Mycena maculata]
MATMIFGPYRLHGLNKRRRLLGLTLCIATFLYAYASWDLFKERILTFPAAGRYLPVPLHVQAPVQVPPPVPVPVAHISPPRPASRLLNLLFTGDDSPIEDQHWPWKGLTRHALRDLVTCLELGNCKPNQEKVVLIGSDYFRAVMKGHNGGEHIWAASTMKAMRNLGYTVLYAESLGGLVDLYRIVPDLVKIVIIDDCAVFRCHKDAENCVQSDENPTGIPIYKILSFFFWSFPRHPLGQRWVLAPEPFALAPDPTGTRVSNNTYLGYSIEDDCALTPFVPHAARPARAWVLAKLLHYLAPARGGAWVKRDFDAATRRTGVQFVLGAGLDQGESAADVARLEMPEKHFNHGTLPKREFMSALAQAKADSARSSPTPYNALCFGVPFINPVDKWEPENPTDIADDYSQHPFMGFLNPPYVYNVRRGDREGFVNAIASAIANPIDSHIPDRMRMAAVQKRLAAIVDNDWEAEARRQAEWCSEPCGCLTPCDTRDI